MIRQQRSEATCTKPVTHLAAVLVAVSGALLPDLAVLESVLGDVRDKLLRGERHQPTAAHTEKAVKKNKRIEAKTARSCTSSRHCT